LGRAARFEPHIPALPIFPPGSDRVAEARPRWSEATSRARLPLVEEYLQMRDPGRTATQGILHLNAANSLLRRLLRLSPDQESFTAALEIIYHNARFFAGRTLTPQEARLGFDIISYSVEELVRSVKENNQ
jgi:hypothetical protein